MASSVVTSVVKQLGSLVVGEVKYLYEVSDKIESLRRDLLWMRCFLEDADNIQHEERVVGMWISEMRDFAYEAQEIIERYLFHVTHHRQNGIWNTIKWFSCSLCDARGTHDAGVKIDSLRSRISELIGKLQLYGVKMTKKRVRSESVLAMREQRRTYSHTNENPVGLENHVKQVVGHLVANNEVKVVGIFGIGGLGKTTLARQIFRDKSVREYFKNNCIWVYVSQQFNAMEIMEEILAGFSVATEDEHASRDASKRPTINTLAINICNVLKDKKCLVVLDDVWETTDWDRIKPAFASIKDSNSKILITTRRKSLVTYVDPNCYSHQLDVLNEVDSWELLRQILQGETSDQVAENKLELAKDMLQHCNGLPLAILTLGGLLSKKKTISEWETVQRNLSHYLINNTEQQSEGMGVYAVLELSFNELPYYLKPCFMYMGMFPEDSEIEAERLYHLWQAEGLVTSSVDDDDDDGIQEVVSLDDMAELYLTQLLDRSMVQAEKWWPKGRIKSCRLHDVMRDMCLKKCRERNFLHILEEKSSTSSANQIVRASCLNRRMRRCTMYSLTESSPVFEQIRSSMPPCIRSLFVTSNKTRRLLSGNGRTFFSLLRVLDAESSKMPIKDFGDFIHLRYLRLSCHLNIDLSRSHLSCKYLETLDLQHCPYAVLNNQLKELQRLRHLFLPYLILRTSKSNKLFLSTTQLQQMETLHNFCVESCRIQDLLEMKNMRNFSFNKFKKLDKECVKILLRSPVIQPKHLVSPLSFLHLAGEVIEEVQSELADIIMSHDDVTITELRISGRIGEVAASSCATASGVFCGSLEKIILYDCEISREGVSVMGKLPLLTELRLYGVAIQGTKIRFSDASFPRLEILSFIAINNLEELEVEEGALPNLRILQIGYCKKLMQILENLPTPYYASQEGVEQLYRRYKKFAVGTYKDIDLYTYIYLRFWAEYGMPRQTPKIDAFLGTRGRLRTQIFSFLCRAGQPSHLFFC